MYVCSEVYFLREKLRMRIVTIANQVLYSTHNKCIRNYKQSGAGFGDSLSGKVDAADCLPFVHFNSPVSHLWWVQIFFECPINFLSPDRTYMHARKKISCFHVYTYKHIRMCKTMYIYVYIWGPPSLLYNWYRVFPGGKAAGAWRWPPTTSSAEVEGRVELYICSPSGPSWPVLGRTFLYSQRRYEGNKTKQNKKEYIGSST